MVKNTPYTLDIVIPCYNEEEALANTLPLLISYLSKIQQEIKMQSYCLILVDDGSEDNTWNIISSESEKNDTVSGLRLSKNFGHQNAMLAGLSHSKADAVLTIDADLQDDIRAIKTMLKMFEQGEHIVLGVRNKRTSDSFLKRTTANAYYKILAMLGVPAIPNHADFRLVSRQALDAILAHDEVNLFFRGIVNLVGFKPKTVLYARQARKHGTTKYSIKKMFSLAIDGITSFSVYPLRIVAFIGFFLSFLSGIFIIWILAIKIFYPNQAIAGWASIVLPIFFLGGIQILSIGILGEYIGKIYLETKKRPRYFIMDSTTKREI